MVKLISALKTISFALILISFAQCSSTSKVSNPSEKTMFIAAETKDCVGVGPMKCLQVKETESAPWQNFYSKIEGFTYEPGYEYKLIIRTEKRENVPADASSIRYILVKEVSKKKK